MKAPILEEVKGKRFRKLNCSEMEKEVVIPLIFSAKYTFLVLESIPI